MKPKQVSRTLVHLLPSKLAIMISGAPGIGKSSVVRQAGKALGRNVIDVRAVLLDPVDIRGIPVVGDDRVARWSLPSFLPQDPKATDIIFLDELPQAAPLVQSAFLSLTLDRRVGEYELPEGCSIVAAGNRIEDRAGAHRMITPLANRFVHLNMDTDLDEWLGWAADNGIDGRVLAFIRFRPDMLMAFDPKKTDEMAFPSPRSWEFTSRAIEGIPEDLLYPIVAGCVGGGAAAEFVNFVDLQRDLPDAEALLKDPKNSLLPTDTSLIFAVIGAMYNRIKTLADEKSPKLDATLRAYAQYVTRFDPEYAMMALMTVLRRHQKFLKTPEVAAWMVAHSREIAAAGQH